MSQEQKDAWATSHGYHIGEYFQPTLGGEDHKHGWQYALSSGRFGLRWCDCGKSYALNAETTGAGDIICYNWVRIYEDSNNK